MKALEHVPLSDVVYYRIGGKARYFIKVTTVPEVLESIRFAQGKKIENVLILGLGSNILIPDRDYDGLVVMLEGTARSHEVVADTRVRCFAGESVDSLINFAFDHDLIGLQWAGGLPSTVGGAIRGNAGAFGSEIRKTVFAVEAVDRKDPDLQVKTYHLEDCAFSYRDSFFKHNPDMVILSGTFVLKKGSDEELVEAKNIYQHNINYRQSHHPMEYPSCGSVFKNIIKKDEVDKIVEIWPDVRELSEKKWHNKISMGYVINRLGFSGKRIGGAMVSQKHTNYIVNIDHAQSKDVHTLIQEIQEKFQATFGFMPEPEVMIL